MIKTSEESYLRVSHGFSRDPRIESLIRISETFGDRMHLPEMKCLAYIFGESHAKKEAFRTKILGKNVLCGTGAQYETSHFLLT